MYFMAYYILQGENKLDREILKGNIEIVFLILLSKKELYGYEMSKTLNELGLPIAEGTLYPILKRLENNKLITSYLVKNENNNIKRKYYKITINGIQSLEEKIYDFNLMSNIINKLNEER